MISIVWCPHLISSPAPTPIKIICSHNEEWDYLINLINGMDYGWVGTFTIRSASLPCYYYYQLLTIYILHIFMQIYYNTHIQILFHFRFHPLRRVFLMVHINLLFKATTLGLVHTLIAKTETSVFFAMFTILWWSKVYLQHKICWNDLFIVGSVKWF